MHNIITLLKSNVKITLVAQKVIIILFVMRIINFARKAADNARIFVLCDITADDFSPENKQVYRSRLSIISACKTVGIKRAFFSAKGKKFKPDRFLQIIISAVEAVKALGYSYLLYHNGIAADLKPELPRKSLMLRAVPCVKTIGHAVIMGIPAVF